MSAMTARWKEISAKFAALQQREKISVAAATVFAVVMGTQTLWVDPAQRRLDTLKKQIVKDKTDLQTLQAQVTVLKAQLKDPDEPNRKQLAEVKGQLAAVDLSLHAYDNVLVPPERAQRLLQSLLARHRGLELVSLQTLPPSPLLAPVPKGEGKPGEAKPADGKADAKTDAKPAAPSGSENIQKHGIEIKVAGSYAELLAYVAELERLPHKLLWDSMSLTVRGYPKSELTLTVSTLSLDSVWLVF